MKINTYNNFNIVRKVSQLEKQEGFEITEDKSLMFERGELFYSDGEKAPGILYFKKGSGTKILVDNEELFIVDSKDFYIRVEEESTNG